MLNIIRTSTRLLHKQSNTKKYSITHDGLELLVSSSKRSQELFLDILYRIEQSNQIDAIIIKVSFKELGFNSYSNLRKYRNELTDRDLLYYEKNQYYVNPVYFNFYTRRQQNFFFRFFNIKKDIKVKMEKPCVLEVV